MNRQDLIRELTKHLTTEKDAKLAVCKTFEIMGEALRGNRKVVISNFGTFKVKERKERMARNPRTGDAVPVPGRRVPIFKVSKMLKDRVATPDGNG